jgi:hypothetical protein
MKRGAKLQKIFLLLQYKDKMYVFIFDKINNYAYERNFYTIEKKKRIYFKQHVTFYAESFSEEHLIYSAVRTLLSC